MTQPSTRDQLIEVFGEIVMEYPPVLLLGLIAATLYLLARKVYKSEVVR